MSGVWRAIGRLPALPVVAWFFALALLVALALGDAATWVGVALFVAFAAYCVARPSGGWDVFAAAAFPSAVATILHDLADTPRWLAIVLIPVSLLWARSIDRKPTA